MRNQFNEYINSVNKTITKGTENNFDNNETSSAILNIISKYPELTKEELQKLPEYKTAINKILFNELFGSIDRENVVLSNIYIAHLKQSNYVEELYEPLKNSLLAKKFNFIFPNEDVDTTIDSREAIKSCKYMIAEVSQPSIKLGMDIEYARNNGVEVICIFKRGYNPASCLKQASKVFIQYEHSDDFVKKLEKYFYTKQ